LFFSESQTADVESFGKCGELIEAESEPLRKVVESLCTGADPPPAIIES
jgi:hypothetical protein